MSEANNTSTDFNLYSAVTFSENECAQVDTHAQNALKISWTSGARHQGGLDEAQKVSAMAEQELLFAAQGLYYPMIAAIIAEDNPDTITVQHLYALLPQGHPADVAKAVELEIAQLYPHHRYCGFLTIRPSHGVEAPLAVQ